MLIKLGCFQLSFLVLQVFPGPMVYYGLLWFAWVCLDKKNPIHRSLVLQVQESSSFARGRKTWVGWFIQAGGFFGEHYTGRRGWWLAITFTKQNPNYVDSDHLVYCRFWQQPRNFRRWFDWWGDRRRGSCRKPWSRYRIENAHSGEQNAVDTAKGLLFWCLLDWFWVLMTCLWDWVLDLGPLGNSGLLIATMGRMQHNFLLDFYHLVAFGCYIANFQAKSRFWARQNQETCNRNH